jgi:hypothetical protein
LKKELIDIKLKIVQNKENSLDYFNQIMPFFHILMFLLIKTEFSNHVDALKELA